MGFFFRKIMLRYFSPGEPLPASWQVEHVQHMPVLQEFLDEEWLRSSFSEMGQGATKDSS